MFDRGASAPPEGFPPMPDVLIQHKSVIIHMAEALLTD